MNLALLIMTWVIVTQIISWVGKSVLQTAAFAVYQRIFYGSVSSSQRKLKKQILVDKAELLKTSSQDEFAKWAKLRRKVDKGLADLEKLNNSLTSAKTKFNTTFSTGLWLLTNGAQYVLVWWYRKKPVFWLPRGWLPGPVAWLLSMPSAPLGSVSSGAWSMVCKRVVATAEEIFKDVWAASVPVQPVPNAPFGAAPGAPAQEKAKVELEHEKLD